MLPVSACSTWEYGLYGLMTWLILRQLLSFPCAEQHMGSVPSRLEVAYRDPYRAFKGSKILRSGFSRAAPHSTGFP